MLFQCLVDLLAFFGHIDGKVEKADKNDHGYEATDHEVVLF